MQGIEVMMLQRSTRAEFKPGFYPEGNVVTLKGLKQRRSGMFRLGDYKDYSGAQRLVEADAGFRKE